MFDGPGHPGSGLLEDYEEGPGEPESEAHGSSTSTGSRSLVVLRVKVIGSLRGIGRTLPLWHAKS